MTLLSVNVNKVACLRNSRGGSTPNVTKVAQICIDAGAHGITVHPRPDQRHIRREDVYDLASMLTVEFNIEGNPTPDFLALVADVHPAQCTLVPDDPDQLTSDHGWDLKSHWKRLNPIIESLKEQGIRVSLFLDPVEEDVRRASETGTDRIELYTESFAAAFEDGSAEAVVDNFSRTADLAHALGLEVNAGHDLNQSNLGMFCGQVSHLAEVSIGHALISESLEDGLSNTVRAYLSILSNASVLS
jgi:pyridoxine 5-phosphate synthase